MRSNQYDLLLKELTKIKYKNIAINRKSEQFAKYDIKQKLLIIELAGYKFNTIKQAIEKNEKQSYFILQKLFNHKISCHSAANQLMEVLNPIPSTIQLEARKVRKQIKILKQTGDPEAFARCWNLLIRNNKKLMAKKLCNWYKQTFLKQA